MTPIERSEKIAIELEKHLFWGNESIHRKWFIETIAAQIEEAEREAVDDAHSEIYAEGFRAARERAKEIAEEFDRSCGCLPKCDSYGHEDLCTVANTEPTIAQRIGEMEP